MSDIEQDGAAEVAPSGVEHGPGTPGSPDPGQGVQRRRRWLRRPGNVNAGGGEYVWASGPAGAVAPEADGSGPDGSGAVFEAGAGDPIPARSGTRTPRQFVIAGTAGIAVLGVVGAVLWAVHSPNGPARLPTAEAGAVVTPAATPPSMPSIKVLAATTPKSGSGSAPVSPVARASRRPAAKASPVTRAQAPVPAQQPGPAAAPWPDPVGIWPLNETGGNVAQDYASGATAAQNGTASYGWWIGGSGCLFAGSESQIHTDAPVLKTGSGQSFTVEATVYLNTPPADPHDEAVLSQDASENSSFSLQYSATTNRWGFSRFATDSAGSSAYTSPSVNAPRLRTWTELVGVYDAANHTQYLYVDGVLQAAQAVDPTPFAAGGDFAIGRGLYDGARADWFDGAIKNVGVWNNALDATQVAALWEQQTSQS